MSFSICRYSGWWSHARSARRRHSPAGVDQADRRAATQARPDADRHRRGDDRSGRLLRVPWLEDANATDRSSAAAPSGRPGTVARPSIEPSELPSAPLATDEVERRRTGAALGHRESGGLQRLAPPRCVGIPLWCSIGPNVALSQTSFARTMSRNSPPGFSTRAASWMATAGIVAPDVVHGVTS